jgi:hypothetical protein
MIVPQVFHFMKFGTHSTESLKIEIVKREKKKELVELNEIIR